MKPMSCYLRIQLAIGLCLALIGTGIFFVLVPTILIFVFDERLRELHGDQLIAEQLWQQEVDSLVMRLGTVVGIAGCLIAFSAWIIWLVRPNKPA